MMPYLSEKPRHNHHGHARHVSAESLEPSAPCAVADRRSIREPVEGDKPPLQQAGEERGGIPQITTIAEILGDKLKQTQVCRDYEIATTNMNSLSLLSLWKRLSAQATVGTKACNRKVTEKEGDVLFPFQMALQLISRSISLFPPCPR